MLGFLKRVLIAVVDIGKGLRVSVEQGKPSALDLHHKAVSLFEAMVDIWQREADLCHFARHKGLGDFKAFPVFAAKNIPPDQHLIASDFNFPSIQSSVIGRSSVPLPFR